MNRDLVTAVLSFCIVCIIYMMFAFGKLDILWAIHGSEEARFIFSVISIVLVAIFLGVRSE
jgi:ABC-type sulfate transport system permease subunit